MEMEQKTPEVFIEKETTAPEAVVPAENIKKKRPKAFYVIIAVGAILAATTAYDRLVKAGSTEAGNKADKDKVVISLAPPVQPAIPAGSNPVPAGTNTALSKTPITKAYILEWMNSLRKLSNAQPAMDSPKLEEAAQAWLSAKLLGGSPDAVLLEAQGHNGNRPVHVIYSGEIENAEYIIREKIEPVKGVKEMVASSLYGDTGVYIYQLPGKCHLVIAMQAKAPVTQMKQQSRNGLPGLPLPTGAACANPVQGCASPGVAQQQVPQQQITAKQSRQIAKNARNGVPTPVRPPALGGPNLLDVPPPPPGKTSSGSREYDPYPDQRDSFPN